MDTIYETGLGRWTVREVLRLNGADWNLEIGGLCEIIVREAKKNVPAILFDEIRGYPKGTRALFAMLSSLKRLALTVNLPLECGGMMDFVRAFHEKIRDLQVIPPVTVKQGPWLKMSWREIGSICTNFPALSITRKTAADILAPPMWCSRSTPTRVGTISAPTGAWFTAKTPWGCTSRAVNMGGFTAIFTSSAASQ
jgi:3-polyprenyl-4-hydroxybenzoate decarboxylase